MGNTGPRVNGLAKVGKAWTDEGKQRREGIKEGNRDGLKGRVAIVENKETCQPTTTWEPEREKGHILLVSILRF